MIELRRELEGWLRRALLGGESRSRSSQSARRRRPGRVSRRTPRSRPEPIREAVELNEDSDIDDQDADDPVGHTADEDDDDSDANMADDDDDIG